MNTNAKNTFIALAVVVIIMAVVGMVVWVLPKSVNDGQAEVAETSMKSETATETVADTTARLSGAADKETIVTTPETASEAKSAAGVYTAYNETLLADAAAKGNVVVFFHAPWCPTCRALEADIQAHLDNIPSDLTLLKLDFDSNKELRKKYGVVVQHTLVQVDGQGNKINSWTGSPTLQSIINNI